MNKSQKRKGRLTNYLKHRTLAQLKDMQRNFEDHRRNGGSRAPQWKLDCITVELARRRMTE